MYGLKNIVRQRGWTVNGRRWNGDGRWVKWWRMLNEMVMNVERNGDGRWVEWWWTSNEIELLLDEMELLSDRMELSLDKIATNVK
jgi:hypothetical protein